MFPSQPKQHGSTTEALLGGSELRERERDASDWPLAVLDSLFVSPLVVAEGTASLDWMGILV